jgi:hypothetical protein
MFVLQKEMKKLDERMKRPSYSWRNWGQRKKSNNAEERLPEVPRATMTGICSFVWGNNRTATDGSKHFSDMDSSQSSQIAPGSSISKISV